MKIKDIQPTVVKVGLCEYDDREYRVFICQSNTFPGTGDYEDDLEIREDKECLCFGLWYESIVKKDDICAGGGHYIHLNEAIEAAENKVGFKKWIN